MSPREQVEQHIKRERGGVVAFAEAAGLDFTRVYGWFKGSDLDLKNRGKLRAALPEFPDTFWLEVFAPAPTVIMAPAESTDAA